MVRRSKAKRRKIIRKVIDAEVANVRITTRISPTLHWLERYLRRAKKHMPSLILPRLVKAYKPPLSKEMRAYGTCTVEQKLITLATHRIVSTLVKGRRKKKHVAIQRRDILMTFAHELAHLLYTRHDYEQESYARTIFHAFGLKDKCHHCAGTGLVPSRYVN